MSKYGPGFTTGQVASMEKEQIKMALKGMLAVDENEDEFEYQAGSKEKCDAFILNAYDALYYQLNEALASGRVLEQILKDYGHPPEDVFKKYIQLIEKEKCKYNDYKYEEDEEC